MSELRAKMIRAMDLKNLSHHTTHRAYLAAVAGIARFYNQSPDKMTKEKIEDYLLYLKHDKANAPNSCYSVLYRTSLFLQIRDRKTDTRHLQHQEDNEKTSTSPYHARNLEDHLCHQQSQASSYPDDHLLRWAQSQ